MTCEDVEPIETRWCVRCVISNHRPVASKEYSRTPGSEPGRMAFDEEGVCGACEVAERKSKTDWSARDDELRDVLGRYRRRDGRPDVLVPGSGGKDSVLAAGVLRDRYGMHPLTVTWRPHSYTDVGWRNFNRWLDTGLDNLLVTPNPKVHRTLTRLAFQNLGHPFQPFVLGQRSLAPKLAAKFGISLVMFGELDDDYEGEGTGWQDKLEAPADVYISGVHIRDLIKHHGLDEAALNLYLPGIYPSVKTEALGKYLKWDPEDAYYYAVEHAGFEANEERTEGTFTKFNSIDDRLDPLHYFMTYTKFGVGRASHDASMEIRHGRITREEGVALVRKYDAEEPRPESLKFYCEYMGISEAQFWATVAAYKKDYPVVS